jgi:flagellar biosynthesis regulator FlbT
MKTIDSPIFQSDPVISEVRRVKTALAAKHNFDVMAMVRSLQEREKKQKREQSDPPNGYPPAAVYFN